MLVSLLPKLKLTGLTLSTAMKMTYQKINMIQLKKHWSLHAVAIIIVAAWYYMFFFDDYEYGSGYSVELPRYNCAV